MMYPARPSSWGRSGTPLMGDVSLNTKTEIWAVGMGWALRVTLTVDWPGLTRAPPMEYPPAVVGSTDTK